MENEKKKLFIYPTIEIIELSDSDFIITESDPFPEDEPFDD